METYLYSLVQTELGANIERKTLEDATVGVPSMGKMDCAHIARELFGIVVSGLPIKDAIAFRAALLAKNFPTEIVADRDIPRLPKERFFSRIATNDEGFIFTDALGRSETCHASDVLLLAAGFLSNLKMKIELTEPHAPHPSSYTEAKTYWKRLERKPNLVPTPEFRFECFIKRKPYRLCLFANSDNPFVWNNHALRLEKPDAIHAFMKTWHRLAPRTTWNLGLTNSGTDFKYPSRRAFENEIRWRFYMLKQKNAKR